MPERRTVVIVVISVAVLVGTGGLAVAIQSAGFDRPEDGDIPGNESMASSPGQSAATTSSTSEQHTYIVVASNATALNETSLASYGELGTRVDNRIEITATPAAVSKIEALPWVTNVRRAAKPVPASIPGGGTTTSLGVADLHERGITGQNITVGVIDSGFDTEAASIQDNFIRVKRFREQPASPDHGTSVSEVLVKTAPDVTILGATVGSSVDHEAAIQYFRKNNVDVITASFIFPQFEDDGTHLLTDDIQETRDAGIIYFNSAGNDAQKHWEGAFRDTDDDDFHEWAPDDELNCLPGCSSEFPGGSAVINLRWDAEGDGSWYRVGLWNPQTREFVAQSNAIAAAEGERVQRLAAENLDAQPLDIVVENTAGPGNDELEVRLLPQFSRPGLVFEHTTPASSLAAPADVEETVAVGAFDRNRLALADFSSQGPTDDGRRGLDLIGYTGIDIPSGEFSGTSAATPHAAGVAALVQQASSDELTGDEIEAVLTESADDIRSSGPDPASGFGVVNASAAAGQVDRSVADAPPGTIFRTKIDVDTGAKQTIGLIKRGESGGLLYNPNEQFVELSAGDTVVARAGTNYRVTESQRLEGSSGAVGPGGTVFQGEEDNNFVGFDRNNLIGLTDRGAENKPLSLGATISPTQDEGVYGDSNGNTLTVEEPEIKKFEIINQEGDRISPGEGVQKNELIILRMDVNFLSAEGAEFGPISRVDRGTLPTEALVSAREVLRDDVGEEFSDQQKTIVRQRLGVDDEDVADGAGDFVGQEGDSGLLNKDLTNDNTAPRGTVWALVDLSRVDKPGNYSAIGLSENDEPLGDLFSNKDLIVNQQFTLEAQDAATLNLGDNGSVVKGEFLNFAVNSGTKGQLHVVSIEENALREQPNAPDNVDVERFANVFRENADAGFVSGVLLADGRVAIDDGTVFKFDEDTGEIEPTGDTLQEVPRDDIRQVLTFLLIDVGDRGIGTIDTARLDDTSVDVNLFEGASGGFGNIPGALAFYLDEDASGEIDEQSFSVDEGDTTSLNVGISSPPTKRGAQGGTIEIQYTLTNTGNTASAALVEFPAAQLPSAISIKDVDGDVENSLLGSSPPGIITDQLAPGNLTTITATYAVADDAQPTTAPLTVSAAIANNGQSATNTTTTTVEIVENTSATVTVDSPTSETVSQGGTLDIQYTITNVGQAGSSALIEFPTDQRPRGVSVTDVSGDIRNQILGSTPPGVVTTNVAPDDAVTVTVTYQVDENAQLGTAPLTVNATLSKDGVPTTAQATTSLTITEADPIVARFGGEDNELDGFDLVRAVNAVNQNEEIGGEPVTGFDIVKLVNRLDGS